jgi:hypothetical protein
MSSLPKPLGQPWGIEQYHSTVLFSLQYYDYLSYGNNLELTDSYQNLI